MGAYPGAGETTVFCSSLKKYPGKCRIFDKLRKHALTTLQVG